MPRTKTEKNPKKLVRLEIARLRNENGDITQEILARSLGWTHSKVQRYESGRFTQIPAETIIQVCDFFKVNPEDWIKVIEVN